MKTNQIIIAIVIAALGFGAGYLTRGSMVTQTEGYTMSSSMLGSHTMGGSMQNEMNNMVMGLQGKTGDGFDKAFLSEMIVHHEGAVAMAQAVLKSSKRAELIQLAQDIISAQSKEIDMMKGWQRMWFNH